MGVGHGQTCVLEITCQKWHARPPGVPSKTHTAELCGAEEVVSPAIGIVGRDLPGKPWPPHNPVWKAGFCCSWQAALDELSSGECRVSLLSNVKTLCLIRTTAGPS